MHHLVRAVPTVGFAVLLAAWVTPAYAAQVAPSVVAAPSVRASSDPGDGHDSMPGMDMPAEDMPDGDEPASREPAENMPGMDMPAEDMPAEKDGHAGPVSRPRGAVIGTFAGVNAAALIGAAVLRRRTKDEHHPKRTPRSTAPTTA